VRVRGAGSEDGLHGSEYRVQGAGLRIYHLGFRYDVLSYII
jgi:hypothetical protein